MVHRLAMYATERTFYFLLIFLVQALVVSHGEYNKVSSGCPESCSCVVSRTRDDRNSNDEWSKVKCSSTRKSFDTVAIDELKLNDIQPHILQLELSFSITYLENSFLKLHLLEKLDLSKNGIEHIEEEAFVHLTNLKRLDLSHNRLSSLDKKIFEPLHSLERLKLNNNLIAHLHKGVFDSLTSLKSLDISENPLDCDCSLVWLTEWSKNSSVKLTPVPKCKSPLSSKGKLLRKLKLQCDEDSILDSSSAGSLELKPAHNQIVFEGDSLSLRCRSLTAVGGKGESRDAQVTWLWKDKDPSSYFNEIKIEKKVFADNGFVESRLKIDKIQKSHSGDWYCRLLSESGNLSTAISVIVLSDDSKYCPQVDTRNNKGVYDWPKTLVGFTVDLPCVVQQPSVVNKKVEPRALYTCNEAGFWENLNTTHCPYASETTRILEQFSQVNLSIAKGSVLDSALKLKNFTGNGENLTDVMDIVFISRTVENYLMFVKNERELGYVLVDIVATIMGLPKYRLVSAQKTNVACSKLVRSLEVICRDIPTFQSHKSNLVVEEFGGTGAFSGIQCIWYLNNPGDEAPKRFFRCSTNNRTLLGNTDRVIEASIQIPASLSTQLESQGKLTHHTWQLIVSMYENNNLFPGPSNSYEDVTSCVIGSKLVGINVTNLTEPVYLMLRIPSSSYTTAAKPVWWDQARNNGSGGWSEEGCQSSHYTNGMVVFRCNRFGYFGLLQDTRHLSDYPERYNAKPRLCHPAVYTGSFILIVCLLISSMTYLISHSFIQMSRRAKHAVVNTWISISLLCFIFSCGIYQTGNASVCQGIGIVLHYLFLSTLLWMSVSASNMYKRLSKADPLDSTPEDELPPGAPIQKPILGLYLVGWGIGLIVCGISGAVNLKEYASRNFCFLEFGPALSAVYVPAGMLLAFLTLFYILTLCAIRNSDMNGQLSEGTQGTENVDLELLEVPPVLGSVDRRSVQSIVTADSDDIEDPEHSPIIQLKAHIIVLVLYCFICSLAALSLAGTLQDTFYYYHDVCSILFCLLAFCLGAFILYFYCVARSDVRSQWTVLRKIIKGEQIHCCRNRSVSDTHGNVQVTSSAVIANGTGVRHAVSALSSSSVNSSGLTAKSNSHNSNRVKAVKKLNNCEGRKEPVMVQGTAGANNVNLVAMHRQMYRSNNSMPNYQEILGPDCAEAFYNPRQSIVARKFFKKQRRNKRNDLGLRRRGDGGGTSEGEVSQTRRTWRPSAESAVFLSSDMENASEKVEFGYGPKVAGSAGARHNRKSLSPRNSKALTTSDEENRNKLPLDRLVIGAEESSASIPLKNNGRISSYDYCLSRVDEMSASEDVVSPSVISSSDAGANGCPEDGGIGVSKVPDVKNVQLQCSLGEISCSDGNSENNFCDCGVVNDEETLFVDSDRRRVERDSDPSDDLDGDDEAGPPNCDSFNEKIDAFRLRPDSSLGDATSRSSGGKVRRGSSDCTSDLNGQVHASPRRSTRRSSCPGPGASAESECESEALMTDSEKSKKETSV